MVGSVLFIGVTTAIIVPASNAMPPEILGHGKAGIGFGVINVCGSLGAVLSVPLIGYLIGATGSFEVSLFGIAAFSVAAVILALTLKTR